MESKINIPIGIRNNNPLNLRPSVKAWVGEIKHFYNKPFCEFESMVYGFRAAFKTLRTYRKRYNICTIEGIINRWAPAGDGDNKPQLYINQVVTKLSEKGYNIKPHDILPEPDTPIKANCKLYCNIVLSMACVECGKRYVNSSMAEDAALGWFSAFEVKGKAMEEDVIRSLIKKW